MSFVVLSSLLNILATKIQAISHAGRLAFACEELRGRVQTQDYFSHVGVPDIMWPSQIQLLHLSTSLLFHLRVCCYQTFHICLKDNPGFCACLVYHAHS